MPTHTMPLPTRRRCLELAAAFIENDLHAMRKRATEQYEIARQKDDWDGREFPLGTSLEGDLMKATEWAYALATLRAMAQQEGGEVVAYETWVDGRKVRFSPDKVTVVHSDRRR